MVKYSTATREGLAVVGALRTLLNEFYIRVYSGTIPASADSSLGQAVLMLEVSVGGMGDPLTLEPSAPGGLLTKSAAENWTGNVLVGGTPSFFRIEKDTDTGNQSTTEIRIQGSCGPLGSDLMLTALPLVAATPQAFELFQMAIPEQ